MESLEQLHVEGHRKAFFRWAGGHRKHNNAQRKAHILRAGSMFLAGLACVSVVVLVWRWEREWDRAGMEADSTDSVFPPCTMKCCTGSLTSANQLQPQRFHYLFRKKNRGGGGGGLQVGNCWSNMHSKQNKTLTRAGRVFKDVFRDIVSWKCTFEYILTHFE